MQARYRAGRDRMRVGVASSRGSGHASNEDGHSDIRSQARLFVVADGVGGGALGAVVSAELVRRLHADLASGGRDDAAIRRAVLDADRALQTFLAKRADRPGAATLALCLRRDRDAARWLIAWVGDCRIYRCAARGADGVQVLTVDDSYRHLGELPPPHACLDDPARMVGNGAVVAPNVLAVELHPGDALLLCSDGVHRYVTKSEIAEALQRANDADDAAQRCCILVERARLHGSRDDATALLVQREPRMDPGWFWRAALLVAFAAALAWVAATALLPARSTAAPPPALGTPG
jgi:serine/threonine protein phosphatase PrpC